MAKYPVYTAIDIFQPTMLDGGTSRPLAALVGNGNQPIGVYVLKVFQKKDTAQHCYTGAEAFSHYLAKNMGLNIPHGAFVNIPSRLVESKKEVDPRFYADLKERDLRTCFGTEYLEGLPLFSAPVARKTMHLYDAETIFALDTLLLNPDRRDGKPNILRGVNSYYLIDHEKTFLGINHALELLTQGQVVSFARHHLFYPKIQKEFKKGNIDFNEFLYYASLLDVTQLTGIKAQLKDFQYDTEQCDQWVVYLNEILNKIVIFVEALKGALT